MATSRLIRTLLAGIVIFFVYKQGLIEPLKTFLSTRAISTVSAVIVLVLVYKCIAYYCKYQHSKPSYNQRLLISDLGPRVAAGRNKSAELSGSTTFLYRRSHSRVVGHSDEVHLLYCTTLVCNYNGLKHTITGHNITLRIPKGAIAIDKREYIFIKVDVLMFGPFTFPENTRPISPILWLCPSDVDYQPLKKPFTIILPHCLSNQAVERIGSNNIWFAKAKHNEYQRNKFQIINRRPLFASSGSRNFAILQIQHFCYYCLISDKVKDADVEYCLVQVERPIQQRSEIHFLVVYFLDTCLRAIEEQYPQEDKYKIRHYTTFRFKSDEPAAFLEMKVTGQDINSHCTVALKPNPPRIWESDVDFWKNSTAERMKLKHETGVYPPKIKSTVTSKNPHSIFKLSVEFTGCSRDNELNVDISFPLDISTLKSSFSIEAESQKILSEKPDLAAAFVELLPVANDWKSIGVLLNVPESIMDNINEDHKRVRDCLREMLAEWVKQRPTWTDLVEAVKHVNPCISDAIHKRIPKSL